jgi:alpha-tubulin suppressor-like RCC1 family protein
VFRWGKDYKQKTPREIKILSKKNIVEISGGFEIFCALSGKRDIFCNNVVEDGTVYIYDYQSQMRICELEELAHTRVSRIICGGNHVFAITEERSIYAWVRGCCVLTQVREITREVKRGCKI